MSFMRIPANHRTYDRFQTVFVDVFGQVAAIEPTVKGPLLEDEAVLFLNISYWNGTKAFANETINFAEADAIVQFLNAIIAGGGCRGEDLNCTSKWNLFPFVQ